MRYTALALTVLAFKMALATSAFAHVGIANNTLPSAAAGQAAYAIANSTSEIVFIVPHGCNDEAVPTPPANLDTTKIQVTVPAAIVAATKAASLRPSHQGEFGQVARETLDDGSVRFTWSKVTAQAPADDQLYKVSIRLKTPSAAANDMTIKKYTFLTTQICAVPGAAEYVLDWGAANSPTLLSFPDKRKGFNAYKLDATTLADFTPTGAGTHAAKLKSYFGDAAIVWIGKRAYSPNPHTVAKIDALVAADLTYSNLGTETGVALTADDTLWVKY